MQAQLIFKISIVIQYIPVNVDEKVVVSQVNVDCFQILEKLTKSYFY